MKTVVVIHAYAVLLLVFWARTQANKYSDPYICYGDVCNSDTPAQFCDIVYRLCRRCDEIKDNCFTRQQTFNCTEYCYEIRLENEVEGLRVAGCQVPPPPEHGRFEGTHNHVPINATLNVTCGEGYELVYKEAIRCGDFSMWNGPQPKCEGSGSTNYVLILVIICGICLLVSVLVNIVLVTPNRFRRWLRKRKKTTKETKPLIVQKESETDVDKICCPSDKILNGTGLCPKGTPVDPTAPPDQEIDISAKERGTVRDTQHIDKTSDSKQPNQPPENIDSDKNYNRSGRGFPGSNHTPIGEVHLPTAERGLSQPEHSQANTGNGNVTETTDGAGAGRSTRRPGDSGRQIINNIKVLFYPPQSTADHSTQTSQPQKPVCDKNPVHDTDCLGSGPCAPSKNIIVAHPEENDTAVKYAVG